MEGSFERRQSSLQRFKLIRIVRRPVFLSILATVFMVGCVAPFGSGYNGGVPHPSYDGSRQTLLNSVKLFSESGDLELANTFYAALVKDYPGSSEAVEAKNVIDKTAASLPPELRTRENRRAWAKEGESAWRMKNFVDEMLDTTSSAVFTESSNAVTLSFPYNEPQKATLIVKKSETGTSVFVTLPSAQILCNDCMILVRFDDRPAQKFGTGKSADHRSNVLFIEPEDTFINRILESRRVRIELPFFQNGTRILDFPIQNYPW